MLQKFLIGKIADAILLGIVENLLFMGNKQGTKIRFFVSELSLIPLIFLSLIPCSQVPNRHMGTVPYKGLGKGLYMSKTVIYKGLYKGLYRAATYLY